MSSGDRLPGKAISGASKATKDPALMSSSTPLDLAAKPDATRVPQITSGIAPKSSVTVPNLPAMHHKVQRPPLTLQGVTRATGDPRARMPYIVEQQVRIPDTRPRFAANQPIRVTVPVQKIKEQSSAANSTSSSHTMASIMRPGVIPQTTAIQTAHAQSAPYTSHVPRGPAAIASLAVQKSASVATPIIRPPFTVTQVGSHKTSPQQLQVAVSASDVHIKESGLQLNNSITVGGAKHQIPLNVSSTMFVTPVKASVSTDKHRTTDSGQSISDLVRGEQLVASHQPHHIIHQIPPQVEAKGFKSPTGMTIAITSSPTTHEAPLSKSLVSTSSQLGAALTAPHSLPLTTSAQVSATYISQNKGVIHPQNLVAAHKVSSSSQPKSLPHAVHTVAPIPLQCQPAVKSTTVKSVTTASSVTHIPVATRPKATIVTTASVPIAKVYPQVSSPARNQPADLSGRSTSLPAHSFTPIRLPGNMATVSSSLPVSTSLQGAERPTVAVDIGQSVSYVPSTQAAYYYGNHRLDRSHATGIQSSSTVRPSSTIRPAGPHSQPVRLGQMVVTVNPNRQHQMALHPATPGESVASLSDNSNSNTTVQAALPTIYTLTTIASSPLSANSAFTTVATSFSSSSSSSSSTTPHMSSPRPSILRKRPSEASVSSIRKNLMNNDLDSSNRTAALLKSPMKTSEVGHDSHVGDKVNVKQEPNDNGDNSNDTNADTVNSNSNGSIGTPAYEASPRKKPRKQLLLATELKEMHSSDGEEKVVRVEKEKSETKTKVKSVNKDDDSSKWDSVRKQQMCLMNSYRYSWKSRHNHFLRPTDIKNKDEKKMTVNDLANEKQISQKVNGWKLYHLSIQMDDLGDHEDSILEKFASLLTLVENVQSKSKSRELEKEFHRTIELIKGNLQRCKLIRDQIHESKAQVFKVFDHKPYIIDIINKYVSKRSVKKRERL